MSLQDVKAGGSTKSQYRRSSRRNRPEDLEKEVELILSQEDDSDIEIDIAKENKVPMTTKSNNNVQEGIESPNVLKNNSLSQTPRRSNRKSVKPVQEYEDIVSYKRQLRSISKVGEEINDKEKEGTNMEQQQPRWTPAKVGRVSRKRGRKSRKTVGEKNKSKLKNSSDNEDTTEVKENLQDVVLQSDDENIKKTDNIEVIASNIEKSEESEEVITEVIEEKNEDNFGTYLKNNTLDISDLGLNPLTEENDDFQKKVEKKCETTEVERNVRPDIQVVTTNDDTFNASDCIMLNQADDEEEMQPLQLSDDESSTSPPSKTPRIILTNEAGVDQSLNATAPLNDGSTPKRYSKTAIRMPTPYKKNTDITIIEDDIDEKCEAKEPSITIEISKMEPKEIVLRSIRKRSFSVCIGGAEADNKRKNVTFYSPANQTAILEDLDVRMIQSVKKNTISKPTTTETFVTQRRKRSLSFDEAMINKSKYRTQTPGKMGVTPLKIKPARTKLPNFAAIHQKNFEKMENLVDHVNRKAERAKVLTNSASKERVASAQKAIKTHQASSTATNSDKSKAVKRINLQATVNSTFSGHNNSSMYKPLDTSHKDLHDSKLPVPRIGICKPLVTTETTQKENREVKLPNPRLGIIKPHIISVASNKNKQITPAKMALKSKQIRQIARPAFNLSTAVALHANNAKSANTTSTSSTVTKANALTANTTVAPTMSVDEKMASRRQRHMDMFKGRAANSRTTPGTAEKRFGQLIRGVRSNRRFELQMAHRQNMDH